MAEFGSWAPDLPPFGHNGLVAARNVYPGVLGYEPVRSLAAVTSAALGSTWQGGGAFDGPTGGSALLAGANGGLYSYSSGAWTNKYAGSYSGQWFFGQFGDRVIGVSGSTAPVKYTFSTDTGAVLGGSPPNASKIAIVRDFVFLAGNASAQSTLYWSSINNAEGWTIGTNQCDSQLIPDGGVITGLAGGEYGLVFQSSAIHVFEYVGTPLIFTRRKVSDQIGAVCHGGIAQSGDITYFLSNRGFCRWQGGEISPIGKDKVDRTFFAAYSVLEIQTNLRASIEPNLNLVIWSMPDRLWLYNWVDDKWSDILQAGIIGISTGRTSYTTLEQLDALYPGGIETVSFGVDDPSLSGGNPMLLVAKSDGYLSTFGGTTLLPATLRMAKIELYPGHDAHVRGVRIQGDVASGVRVNVDYAARLADGMGRVTTSDLRANGDMPVLARGRFLQPEIVTDETAAWSYVQGLDIEASVGGRL